MKKIVVFSLIIALFISCKNDDDAPALTYNEFPLAQVNDSGVYGLITVTKTPSGYSFLSIVLHGTHSGDVHPSYIYNNSLSEGGDIAFSLSNINGEDNSMVLSRTALSSEHLNSPSIDISYDELIRFDGHIKILKSESDSTVIAQVNIGSNAQ